MLNDISHLGADSADCISLFWTDFFAQHSSPSASADIPVACDAAKASYARYLVLTPNERLSKCLTEGYVRYQKDQQQMVFDASPVMPLQRWILQLWQKLSSTNQLDRENSSVDTLLLDDLQTWSLWHQSCSSSVDLLYPSGLASLAKDADEILRHWQISGSRCEAYAVGDELTFLQWRQAFEQRLQALGAITYAQCLELLLSRLKQSQLASSRSESPLSFHQDSDLGIQGVMLVGFTELSPLEQSCLDHLCLAYGLSMERWQLGIENAVAVRCGFADEIEELKAAVNWLFRQWRLSQQSPAAKKLALVLPNLAQLSARQRSDIKRLFKEQWLGSLSESERLELPGQAIESMVSFSGGVALGSIPMVKTLHALLQMMNGQWSKSSLLTIIASPFCKAAAIEFWPRRQLHQALQAVPLDILEARTWMETLLHWGLAPFLDKCPLLVQTLHKSLELTVAFEEHLTISTAAIEQPSGHTLAWMTYVEETIQLWEWAQFGYKGQSLTSVEYQQKQKTVEILQQVSSLAVCSLTHLQLMEAFKHLLSVVMFQPKSQQTNIEVLGVLEALGQVFDGIWITGIHNETWPDAAAPHPFIPKEIQRQFQTRRATPEKELIFAQQLVSTFAQSANQVCFSWPHKIRDRLVGCSPVIMGFPEGLESFQSTLASTDEHMVGQHSFDQVVPEDYMEAVDDQGTWPISDGESITSAVSVLRHFAQCPFKAFIKYRCRLSSDITYTAGFDALARGNNLHVALENFWKQAGKEHDKPGSAYLRSISDDSQSLSVKISAAIDLALAQQEKPLNPVWSDTLEESEKQRLSRLLHQWLELELRRGDFQIEVIEQSVTVQLQDVLCQLRVDRIDRLAEGGLLIIDYKSGVVSVSDWFSERCTSPQLPLYALALGSTVKGLMFAVLEKEKPAFKGVLESGVQELLPKKEARGIDLYESFEPLQIKWQDQFSTALAQYKAGVAAVDPVKGDKTCLYCDYSAICRIKGQVSS